MSEIFTGSALCEVTSGGEIVLPRGFHHTARRRAPDGRLFVGVHPESRCLLVYDQAVASQQLYDSERHGSAFAGVSLDAHDTRRRRMFGFVESVMLAPDGMIVLPPLLRDCCRIADAALLVAVGDQFEIWDFTFVRENGPADLALLALLHLKAVNGTPYATAMPADARRPSQPAFQSRLRLHPLPEMRPRHDTIG